MSINMDDETGVVDYSDYRHQNVNLQYDLPNQETGGGNGRAAYSYTFDPLDDVGGLDSNEVAELVYLETIAFIEYEDETADQNVGATENFVGMIGANLSPNNFGERGVTVEGEIIESDTTVDTSVLQTTFGDSTTDSSAFQPFKVTDNAPFDDEANGLGGGSGAGLFHAEKAYRDLTGRGPVLDQTDNMEAIGRIISSDSVIEVRGNLNLHMIWDIAEMDESGREFQVPM